VFEPHPAGVRGLKQQRLPLQTRCLVPHPAGVRGLKHNQSSDKISVIRSHPAGVRGLGNLFSVENSACQIVANMGKKCVQPST